MSTNSSSRSQQRIAELLWFFGGSLVGPAILFGFRSVLSRLGHVDYGTLQAYSFGILLLATIVTFYVVRDCERPILLSRTTNFYFGAMAGFAVIASFILAQ
jgi:hypothetical protein